MIRVAGVRSFALASSGFAVLFVVWILATSTFHLIAPVRFPSPKDVYDAFVQLTGIGYADADLGTHILSSLRRVMLGYAIAIVTATPLGIFMGLSRTADGIINPIFQLLRPIPALAWIPLAILWFGLGTEAQVFVIALAAFAPLLINTYTGVRIVSPLLVSAAQVLGASRMDVVMHVVLPSSLPMIFTGLRISLQVCWMALVAAELVGSTSGLGHIMIYGERDINSPMIAAGMICVTALGAIMTVLLSLVERRVMPWRA